MTRDMSRFVPAGLDWETESKRVRSGLIWSTVLSLLCPLRYLSLRRSLFAWNGVSWALRQDAVMQDFSEVVGIGLVGFAAMLFGMAALAAWYFLYHRSGGSRADYLMRRLPDRFELPRRCVSLPVIGALASIVLAAALLAIYFGIYMTFTPAECLTGDQLGKLWRAWMGG